VLEDLLDPELCELVKKIHRNAETHAADPACGDVERDPSTPFDVVEIFDGVKAGVGESTSAAR
jgi:hypothetical protein